ncbi:hypothetical protein [Parasutterella excrementihominis]|uniref:hypothetical protein n=1 Tax=Parasutterella excrementihominis TaxID=487175 RepID=UPI0022E03FB6|nr:hypothetical protein [Parasutterella excrementihominis]
MTIYKQMEYQMRLPEYETLAEGKDDGYEWKVFLTEHIRAAMFPSLKIILSMAKILPKSREILKFMAV